MRKILSIGRYSLEGEVLGRGNFGRVELATHKYVRVKVAIKIIDTRKLDTPYSSRNLYREAKILAQLRHPNIVRLYETLKASYLYCLVLEYVPNKDLGAFLKTLPENRMFEHEAWPMVRQMTSALLYLHRHKIVHRDLKMANILLDETNENIKIVDFGLSNMFNAGQLLKTHCGTPEFSAPELFQDRHDYGHEVDIWSLGVIIYGMVVGSLPFSSCTTDLSKLQALLKVVHKGLAEEHKLQMSHLTIDTPNHRNPTVPNFTDCRTMLFQLIEPKPELRLPITELAEHPWLTKNGKNYIRVNCEPPFDKPLHVKVVSKLAHMNKLDEEYVESSVGIYKYDNLSSQYNMLMDWYGNLRRSQMLTTRHSSMDEKRTPSPRRKNAAGEKNVVRRLNKHPSRMKALIQFNIKDDLFIEHGLSNGSDGVKGFSNKQRNTMPNVIISNHNVDDGENDADDDVFITPNSQNPASNQHALTCNSTIVDKENSRPVDADYAVTQRGPSPNSVSNANKKMSASGSMSSCKQQTHEHKKQSTMSVATDEVSLLDSTDMLLSSTDSAVKTASPVVQTSSFCSLELPPDAASSGDSLLMSTPATSSCGKISSFATTSMGTADVKSKMMLPLSASSQEPFYDAVHKRSTCESCQFDENTEVFGSQSSGSNTLFHNSEQIKSITRESSSSSVPDGKKKIIARLKSWISDQSSRQVSNIN